MNKAELSAKLAKKNDISKQEAIKLVDSVFDILTETLVSNEKVTIIGFGSLDPVVSKERMGRNPKTGEAVKVVSKRKVRWGISNILKNKLNGKTK